MPRNTQTGTVSQDIAPLTAGFSDTAGVFFKLALKGCDMGFFTKSFNRRWSLYVVRGDQSAYAMHGNCVIQIVGYVMGYFANGSRPIPPWNLYLCSNGKQILLGPEHFTSDGDNPTHLLIQQIESIDSRWNGFKAGEIWCEDVVTKKPLKIIEYAPKIDVHAMFENINKPREFTFYSAMDEVFGKG